MIKHLFTFLILFPLGVAAQDFHVQTNGNDGGTGTEADPWESIQHAMDNATPGSTVHIHQGFYNERLYMNVSGTDGNYITFQPFEGQDVLINGTGLSDYALLEMYDVHHIRIWDLRFMDNRQADAVGILIEGACDHIIIEDCEISNIHFSENEDDVVTSETNAQPIVVYGTEADHAITDIEILNNEVFNCRLGFSEALAINGNVDGFLISGNKVRDMTNIGIDVIGHEGTCSDSELDQARNGVITNNEVYNCLSPYATAAGIYVDGGKDLIIERNTVHNNQWGIEVGCENVGKTTSNVIVRNNFVYRNSTAGLHVGGYDYPAGSGKVVNTQVINNSFFGNDTEGDWTGELYLSYNEDLFVTNNIFFAENAYGVLMSDENLDTSSIGVVITSNAWYHPLGNGSVEWTYEGNSYDNISSFNVATGFAPLGIFVDPEFTILGGEPDLHLTATSGDQIIDNGTATSSLGDFDIDGEMRVMGSAIDLGADEFGGDVNVGETTLVSLKVYPNPAENQFRIQGTQSLEVVRLMNSSGQLIWEDRSVSDNEVYSTEELDSGVYVLWARTSGNQILSKKICVK